MAFRLRPRLYRREAIGAVNSPQPVEGFLSLASLLCAQISAQSTATKSAT
jgi:hypothetical protein